MGIVSENNLLENSDEEDVEILDDSNDDQNVDDQFEDGESLVGEKYVPPVKDDKFVDVHKGIVIDKKDVSPLLQIKAFNENNGRKIKDPKSGCKKCYGRGYIGYNITTQSYTECSCIHPVLSPEQKKRDHYEKIQNGTIKPSAEDLRQIIKEEAKKEKIAENKKVRDLHLKLCKYAEEHKLHTPSLNQARVMIKQAVNELLNANTSATTEI